MLAALKVIFTTRVPLPELGTDFACPNFQRFALGNYLFASQRGPEGRGPSQEPKGRDCRLVVPVLLGLAFLEVEANPLLNEQQDGAQILPRKSPCRLQRPPSISSPSLNIKEWGYVVRRQYMLQLLQ